MKNVLTEAAKKASEKKPEAAAVVPETNETKPDQVILAQSKEDLFLRQLLGESKKEPDVWFANQVEVDEEYQSIFRLPDELCAGHSREASEAKNYAYVWVEVSDERIARMYVAQHFIPVNRTNHPWLPKGFFSTMGAIERHGYSRHVLFYQPKDYNEKVKAAKAQIADERRKELNEKVEAMDGAVRLEQVDDTKKAGGYGNNPGDAPIVTDWQGNLDPEAREAYNAAE